MKKILFFTSSPLADPKRGTPIRMFNFLRQMSKNHELWVAAPSIDDRLSVKTVEYPIGNRWRQARSLAEIVRAEKIDLVMTATEIDLLPPVLVKWLTGVKIAIDLHGLYAEESYAQQLTGYWWSRMIQLYVTTLLRFYDLIFVVSPLLGDYYKTLRVRIEVIYGGVNADELDSRQITPPAVFTIGYTGNARAYQGIYYILDAAAKLNQSQLFPFKLNLIMSSGRGEIETYIEKLGLSPLTEIRYKVSHEEANELIAQSSVLAIPRPSIAMTEYAYPSKLPEYLATGVPAILTLVGPVKSLLMGADCAKLIPVENIVENLTEALIEVEALGAAGRAEMGRRAAQFVRDNLLWEKLGEKINFHLAKI